MELEIGYDIGNICNRDGCSGEIISDASDDMSCRCHLSPPCAKCTAGVHCNECGWSSDDEYYMNRLYSPPTKIYEYPTWKERCSNPDNDNKILTDIKEASGSWRIYRVRYPLNITLEQVLVILGYTDKYYMPRFSNYGTDNKFNYADLSICLD